MRPRRHKVCQKTKQTYPCGICSKQCETDCTKCGECGEWFHIHFESIRPGQLKVLGSLDEEYLCVKCTHVGDKYDFSHALRRLSTSVTLGNLDSAVKIVTILLRNRCVLIANN